MDGSELPKKSRKVGSVMNYKPSLLFIREVYKILVSHH